MKALLSILTFVFASTAFANQSLVCTEVQKKGTRSQPGQLVVAIVIGKNGQPSTKSSLVLSSNFTKKGEEAFLAHMTVNSFNEHVMFLNNGDDMLDIQLQMNGPYLNRAFTQQPAQFVIASDDANPETGFAIGFDVLCDSTILK